MADNPEILKYGQELKDQVDLIAGVSDAQLGLLQDIRDIVRERANLEKEYATKLSALTKRAQEKKAKRMLSVVLGEEPAKVYTEDTVRSSTLDAAYSLFLASWEESATLHSTYSVELGNGIAEELRRLFTKKEDTKRAQSVFYAKLMSERDRIYADRAKCQQKYYDECGEVEAARQKQEKSTGHDRHAERAAKQYEQQKTDMFNCKNNYIISSALANKLKTKLYQEDIPDLSNQYQEIQYNTMARLVEILTETQNFTKSHLSSLLSKAEHVQSHITAVNITRDQNLFIQFNLRHFTPPPDWKFEVCTAYYDTDTINTDPAPKVFLQNKYSRAQTKLIEAKGVVDTKQSEADSAKVNLKTEHADEKIDKYLEAQHLAVFYKTSVALLEKEIEVVKKALGDDVGAQQPHNFKSSAFSIPTTCEYCHSSIWGLSKQGKTCKTCGISVHTKCEMKMPAECSGKKTSNHGHTRSSLSLSRITSPQDKDSGKVSPSPRSSDVGHGTPTPTLATPTLATPSSFTTLVQHEEHPIIWATVVFDFVASSPYELSVDEGTRVKVLEEDDGSGWIKILKTSPDKSGLVPASYLKLDTDEDTEDDEPTPDLSMPVPAPSHIARSGRFVVAVYPYDAQGDDELSLMEGERYELTGGEHGGDKYGEGWWEGINAHGKHGIFPSNYVQLI